MNWVDYLVKRWPLVIALISIIFGVAKTQFVQNAQADQISDINEQLKGVAAIQAEFPYLKNKVDEIGKKQDATNEKMDKILIAVTSRNNSGR